MLFKNNFEDIRFQNDYPINLTSTYLPETFPEHWHNYAELIISKQEGIRYSINNTVFTLNEHDILLIHPGELHSLIYNPPKDPSYLLIQFDYSLLLSMTEFKKHIYWFQKFHYFQNGENPKLTEEIIKCAEEMFAIDKADPSFKDARICCKLYEMFIAIGEYVTSDQFIHFVDTTAPAIIPSGTKKSTHQSEITQKMIDVCSYLSQNCTEDISLDDAAEYAGFSRYHFSRLFKEFTGLSYVEFITEERLRRACELLASNTLSITDVALMSGFSSISTFNRCFLKYRKDTPSSFRAKFQDSPENFLTGDSGKQSNH